MDTYNHNRFLRWAQKTPGGSRAEVFSSEAASAIFLAETRRQQSPTLSPDTTIALLVEAGHLIDEGDGRYRRT
jgi:hypothetical protein